ncbi:cysteine desulfurase family protein [Vibrio breoganii]
MYLDYLASTPIHEEVIEVMDKAWRELYANPSSNHSCGSFVKEALIDCQKSIADKIGAEPSEIIFTSGATESNNLAIKGLANKRKSDGNHLITSSIEHSCVLNIFKYLERNGFKVTYISPNKDGIITKESVKLALRPNTTLVSIMHVNNELGTINPVRDIGDLCFKNNILFHTDAAQSIGKLHVDVLEDNIDALSASAHKFGGPKGIGFLFLRDARSLELEPVIHGSEQQHGLRGGTVPTPLIIGMTKALETFNFDKLYLANIRKRFFRNLDTCKIKYKVNGKNTLENVINITFESHDDFATYTSQPSLCVSQGSACNSKSVKPSHVLTEIGVTTEDAFKSIRISFYNEVILDSIITLNN